MSALRFYNGHGKTTEVNSEDFDKNAKVKGSHLKNRLPAKKLYTSETPLKGVSLKAVEVFNRMFATRPNGDYSNTAPVFLVNPELVTFHFDMQKKDLEFLSFSVALNSQDRQTRANFEKCTASLISGKRSIVIGDERVNFHAWNKPQAVQKSVHVEPPAAHVEQKSVHVEPPAAHVEPAAEQDEPSAAHVEQPLQPLQPFQGPFPMPFQGPFPGAFPMPFPPGAFYPGPPMQCGGRFVPTGNTLWLTSQPPREQEVVAPKNTVQQIGEILFSKVIEILADESKQFAKRITGMILYADRSVEELVALLNDETELNDHVVGALDFVVANLTS